MVSAGGEGRRRAGAGAGVRTGVRAGGGARVGRVRAGWGQGQGQGWGQGQGQGWGQGEARVRAVQAWGGPGLGPVESFRGSQNWSPSQVCLFIAPPYIPTPITNRAFAAPPRPRPVSPEESTYVRTARSGQRGSAPATARARSSPVCFRAGGTLKDRHKQRNKGD